MFSRVLKLMFPRMGMTIGAGDGRLFPVNPREKVDTAVDVSDVLTKCLTSVTRNALFMQVDRIANGLRNSYVRHLGGTVITGA